MTYATNQDLIDRVGEEQIITASDVDGDLMIGTIAAPDISNAGGVQSGSNLAGRLS